MKAFQAAVVLAVCALTLERGGAYPEGERRPANVQLASAGRGQEVYLDRSVLINHERQPASSAFKRRLRQL